MVFEFMISTVIFFGLVLYVMNQITYSSDVLRTESYESGLEALSVYVSESLVKSPGTWSEATALSLGIEDDWPYVNSTKIRYLNTTCSTSQGYNYIRNMLTGALYHIKIIVKDSSGYEYMNCGYGINQTTGRTTRYALNESGNALTLDFYVW